ncbi:DUF5753 domain-containing protein [Streptomyces sp. NPDC057638]|uniref:DUF5753 domain-containing protein n=1 Tax=Streptomyces sp. NPDC057638 TaxID=3346190 RepID=UPI00368F3669
MTRKEAVRGLKDLSEPTLARIELGELNFRRNIGNLRTLLKRYGVTDEALVDRLIALNREGPSEEWLAPYRSFMPTGMPTYVGLEAEAAGITAYHPTVVYGLLQTEAYARALLEAQRPVDDTTSEFVDRHVELRMERKRRVLDGDAPARLRLVLGEAALRVPVGAAEVMRGQYEEVLRFARRDIVSVRILPFTHHGYRAPHDFTILDLGELPSRVQADSAWGSVSTSDKPRDVDRFTRRFAAMESAALGTEESIAYLETCLETSLETCPQTYPRTCPEARREAGSAAGGVGLVRDGG